MHPAQPGVVHLNIAAGTVPFDLACKRTGTHSAGWAVFGSMGEERCDHCVLLYEFARANNVKPANRGAKAQVTFARRFRKLINRLTHAP